MQNGERSDSIQPESQSDLNETVTPTTLDTSSTSDHTTIQVCITFILVD